MRQIRVVVPHRDGHIGSLAARVAELQKGGKRILFVTADRPYRTVEAALAAADVDVSLVHFLDCVSSIGGPVPRNGATNATFVASPTMLEMMAMRVEQLAARIGPDTHVVLDSLSTLALYNGAGPVHEFSHYLANRLRTRGLPGDFVVTDNAEGIHLSAAVASFTDSHLILEARP